MPKGWGRCAARGRPFLVGRRGGVAHGELCSPCLRACWVDVAHVQWRGAEFWQRRMGTRSEHACKHLPYRRSSSRSSSRRHATTAPTAASASPRRLRSSRRNDPWAREWRVCHIHAHQVLELSPPAPRTPDCLRRRRLRLRRLRFRSLAVASAVASAVAASAEPTSAEPSAERAVAAAANAAPSAVAASASRPPQSPLRRRRRHRIRR